MFFTLKALVRSLLLPPAGPLLLAVLGAWLLGRRRVLGGWILAAGLGSLWLLATPVVADFLSARAERYPPFDPSRAAGAQAVVVLGGGGARMYAPEYGGPAADSVLLGRLSYAAYLAQHLSLPVLVSGAREEAPAMQATLQRLYGIKVGWVENRSRDTYQNARFSAKLLQAQGIHTVILVTSSTHEWRAAHEFMDAGLAVLPAPEGMLSARERDVYRFVPSPDALLRSQSAAYELLGEEARRLQSALGIRERLEGG